MLTFAFPFLLTNLVVLDYKTLVLLLVKNTNAAFMLVVEVSVSSSTSEDVRKVIVAMPSNKAPGYDRIPVFVIKDCLPYILPTLTALINSSFSNSVFPKAWKKSEVVPHLKDGDHEIPSNNRPISLLPVLSKVTEKIALNQFTDYLTQQGNLTCHQSGNRKHHSTETLSLLVTGHIYKAMDKKEITAMVLIDLSKAFDSICHRTLLTKLKGLSASNEASKRAVKCKIYDSL